MAPSPDRLHVTLREAFGAAVAAVEPESALERALPQEPPTGERPLHLLATGKAADAMARAAITRLRSWGRAPAGGVVVAAHESGEETIGSLRRVVGDHPAPGEGSALAARCLGEAVAEVGPGDEVWVLLSGGSSSLLAAPVDGLSGESLGQIFELVLASGLDISKANLVRKRFSRWAGGRLALALAGAHVQVYALSDVLSDEPRDIGSGPCADAAEVRKLLEQTGLWERLPEDAARLLGDQEEGRAPGTLGPEHLALAGIRTTLVARNADALASAAEWALLEGFEPRVVDGRMSGEAADAGRRIAVEMAKVQAGLAPGSAPALLLWGGETTVTLPPGSTGRGGRSQELALAASSVLAGLAGPAALIAAGTDGRDGPTDAAGAIVDRDTWEAVRAAGRDPAADLANHDAYPALKAARALLRTGPTGTNVMDVVAAAVFSRP